MLADPDTVAVCPPGAAVTVYPLIALPPSASGGVQVTLAAAVKAVARTNLGDSGGTAAGAGVSEMSYSRALPVFELKVEDPPLTRTRPLLRRLAVKAERACDISGASDHELVSGS